MRACACVRARLFVFESVEHKTHSFRRLFCKPIVMYHPSSLFFTRFHSSNVYLSLLGWYPYTYTCTRTHLDITPIHTRRDEAIFFLCCFYFYWPARKLCVLCFGPRTFRFCSSRITLTLTCVLRNLYAV